MLANTTAVQLPGVDWTQLNCTGRYIFDYGAADVRELTAALRGSRKYPRAKL